MDLRESQDSQELSGTQFQQLTVRWITYWGNLISLLWKPEGILMWRFSPEDLLAKLIRKLWICLVGLCNFPWLSITGDWRCEMRAITSPVGERTWYAHWKCLSSPSLLAAECSRAQIFQPIPLNWHAWGKLNAVFFGSVESPRFGKMRIQACFQKLDWNKV